MLRCQERLQCRLKAEEGYDCIQTAGLKAAVGIQPEMQVHSSLLICMVCLFVPPTKQRKCKQTAVSTAMCLPQQAACYGKDTECIFLADCNCHRAATLQVQLSADRMASKDYTQALGIMQRLISKQMNTENRRHTLQHARSTS